MQINDLADEALVVDDVKLTLELAPLYDVKNPKRPPSAYLAGTKFSWKLPRESSIGASKNSAKIQSKRWQCYHDVHVMQRASKIIQRNIFNETLFHIAVPVNYRNLIFERYYIQYYSALRAIPEHIRNRLLLEIIVENKLQNLGDIKGKVIQLRQYSRNVGVRFQANVACDNVAFGFPASLVGTTAAESYGSAAAFEKRLAFVQQFAQRRGIASYVTDIGDHMQANQIIATGVRFLSGSIGGL